LFLRNKIHKSILNYLVSSFLSSVFLAGAFFSFTSSSFLPSLFSLFSIFLDAPAGAFFNAFKERPILFFLGSKFIILASTSSPTLTKSLISLTTQ